MLNSIKNVRNAAIYWATAMGTILFALIHSHDWQIVVVMFLLYLIGALFAANEYTRGIAFSTKAHNDAIAKEIAQWRAADTFHGLSARSCICDPGTNLLAPLSPADCPIHTS